jgi:hypothetical protein
MGTGNTSRYGQEHFICFTTDLKNALALPHRNIAADEYEGFFIPAGAV